MDNIRILITLYIRFMTYHSLYMKESNSLIESRKSGGNSTFFLSVHLGAELLIFLLHTGKVLLFARRTCLEALKPPLKVLNIVGYFLLSTWNKFLVMGVL